MRIATAVLAAAFSVASAFALNVAYDGRTPEESREWADRNYLREYMEVGARDICRALYGDEERSRFHENFKMTLFLAPLKGGNPAFASGGLHGGARAAGICRACG